MPHQNNNPGCKLKPSTAVNSKVKTDVLVVCALQDEYRELLNVTEGILSPGWVERPNTQGWMIAQACFHTLGGQQISVLASFASNMGREHALALIHKLLQEHPARCLAMTGICAGRRGKVMLGDVIFADRLYGYDSGKLTVEAGVSKFAGDPLQYHPSAVWLQRIQSAAMVPDAPWVHDRPVLTHEEQEDWVLRCRLDDIDPTTDPDFSVACPDWPDVLARLWRRKWLLEPMVLSDSGRRHAEKLRLLHPGALPQSPAFRIHFAPLATGAAVVEDEGIFPRLAESMRKVLGIDMEASALGVAGDLNDLPVVVVKGVSDYGDAFKDDRYRVFAARAAAECLIALMKRAGDLLGVQGDTRPAIDAKSEPAVPLELIRFLADAYPEPANVRAVWQRAGGRAGEVEHTAHPQDCWQRLWQRSTQGAAVRPAALLRAVQADFPGNDLVKYYLTQCATA